ncbi:MAG: ATP-binding protein [Verrucomicrobiales bacterium]|nr:ATP-binding protein [Verrucomicrobiales bacterium]
MPSPASYSLPPPPSSVSLFEAALALPSSAIAYEAGRLLREQCPGKALLECSTCGFDLEAFFEAGMATATVRHQHMHNQIVATWRGCSPQDGAEVCRVGEEGIRYRPANAWLEVAWDDRRFSAIRLEWLEFARSRHVWFLLGDDRAVLEEFYSAVCRWTHVPHSEVLVYEKGSWRKDRDLYASIRDADAADLVLAPGLKEDLFRDLQRFFDGQELYRRLGVPWKRGILLLGPPGNGKTHAIRAVCRMVGLPVLYVRSLESSGMFQSGEQGHVAEVFELARHMAPCLLVLEDLDSLMTPSNRSVLLNELDGFAQNSGLCVLATTNYPERLDPSILDRPSRFDRKYAFELPGPAERKAYLERWSGRQTAELRIGQAAIDAIVQETDGFSFAYLKELGLASAMARVNAGDGESMDDLALAQARALQAQRRSLPTEPVPPTEKRTENEIVRALLENL